MLSLLAACTLAPAHPLVLAHYMPWYENKSISGKWGWHWTMNHFDPEKVTNGRREIASKLYPLIGPYDSNDPDVIECQVLQMKIAGIDGVIIDWYGTDDVYDYATNHRNTLRMIQAIKKAGMKFAICYEDQTVPNLIKFGKTTAEKSVAYGKSLMDWIDKNWFADPAYVKVDGKPLMMVFGPQYYKAPQYKEILAGRKVNFLGVMFDHGFADGGFAWPNPRGGDEKCRADFDAFYARAKNWKTFAAGAFPRFQDIYQEAGVHDSWGSVTDREGKTYSETLAQAFASGAPVVQLITWNDWGEGTVIEPSQEYGYRDLERTQKSVRKHTNPKLPYNPEALRLPLRLYQLRKKAKAGQAKDLDKVRATLLDGKTDEAKRLLERLETQ
ncbi:MAG: hypothetical protein BGO01_14945 [Armatimonadetes bacterium 55-13]|nr:hypothetical protein [Armatimonadota bacterium]OJU65001.1 MAG: hypothetical protein BGO01_14945 [Armatimonadetes bacterium 55-13]